MNEEIASYIETEKELSKYNITMLSRGEQTPAKRRLIEIEKDFIAIPFNKISLQTVKDAEEAVNLYRQSRRLFYLKYDLNNTEKLISKISKKVMFLDQLSANLIKKRIIEVNPVQDKDIYEELVEHFSDKKNIPTKEARDSLKHKTIDELLDIEPSVIAKKRARLQTILYSLGRYIQDFVDYDLDLEREVNSDFNLVNHKIDNFVFNLEKHAFCFYNESLHTVPKKIASTMGKNVYIERIYSLDNVFSFYKHAHTHTHVYTFGKKVELSLNKPKLGNIYYGYKNILNHSYSKDSDRESKGKVFGIIFPIERVSREKMTPMHIEIYASGIDITDMFCSSISNIRVFNEHGKKIYYKGILMKPTWQLLKMSEESMEYRYILSVLFDEPIDNFEKFNDKKFITHLNTKETPFIGIDASSQILIPKTRSEEKYLEDIAPLLGKRILEIKNDYKNII